MGISRKSSQVERVSGTNGLVCPTRATQCDNGRGTGVSAWEAVLQRLSRGENFKT